MSTILNALIIIIRLMSFKSDRQELVSRLVTIVAHIYKFEYFRSYSQGGHSWLKTIKRESMEVKELLHDNGNLRRDFIESLLEISPRNSIIKDVWKEAINLVINDLKEDIKLETRNFPTDIPIEIKCKLVCYLFCPEELCHDGE